MIKYNVIFWDDYCKKFKFIVSYINRYGNPDMEGDLYIRKTDNYNFTKNDKITIGKYFDYDLNFYFIPRWMGKCISVINRILLGGYNGKN